MRPWVKIIAFVCLLSGAAPSIASSGPCEKLFAGLRRAPGFAYKILLRNTVNDYQKAWRIGNPWLRPYRLTQRFLFAPRVRPRRASEKERRALAAQLRKDRPQWSEEEIQTALRSELRTANLYRKDLEKTQWLTALNEPIFDGAIEMASQLKQRHGPSLGLSAKPITANISIPGGIMLGLATGYSTFDIVYDSASAKVEEHRRKAREKKYARDRNQLFGPAYLEEWQKLELLEAGDKTALIDWHNGAMAAWLKNYSSADPLRPLPPRFYQFQVEGLLRTAEELSAFEDIARAALAEGGRAFAKNSSVSQEEAVKRALRAGLEGSPLFKGRTYLEKEILLMAFDPPVFFDRNDDHSWFKAMKAQDPAVYQSRRKKSDLFWLAQSALNQRDPVLRSVGSLVSAEDQEFSAAPFAAFAASNFTPEGKKEIEEKQKAARASPWFAEDKLPLVSRLDYPGNIENPVAYFDKAGGTRMLLGELDYLNLWMEHPLFRPELEGQKFLSASKFRTLKEKTEGVRDLLILQDEAKKVRDGGPGGSAPPPTPEEICYLAQENGFVRSELKTAPADEPFCRYLLVKHYWQVAEASQQEWITPKVGGAELSEKFSRNLEAVRKRCVDPDYREKFAEKAGLRFPDLVERLRCQ